MTQKTRIAVVTGARSDYGYLKPLMQRIQHHQETVLLPIITGMHLSPSYGYTIQHIIKDGFTPSATIEMLLNTDTPEGIAKSIALGILGHIEEIPRLNPDFTVVLGDRFEIFAAGIAVLHSSSILVHLHGGDVGTGVHDNYYRRGLTNLAQVHFVATIKSMQRVLAQGTNPNYVYLAGSTTIDNILSFTPMTKQQLASIIPADPPLDPQKQWVLAIYHPSTNTQTTIHEFKTMLKALHDTLDLKTTEIIMIYPNADPGNQAIIKQYQTANPAFKTFTSLPYEQYLSLMHHASFMIGNSSSGIIEAPALHLPVINIGERQENREQGHNVINVPAELNEIIKAIKQVTTPKFKERVQKHGSPYGDGNASKRILNKLLEIPPTKTSYSAKYHDNTDLITRLQSIRSFTFDSYPSTALNALEIIKHYT